jgi:hypothetical protein
VLALPESFLHSPWKLLRVSGELRLAYATKYFGEGFPMGTFTGGRAHLVEDNDLSADTMVFNPADLVYDWRKRPSSANVEKAKQREQEQRA